jgi:hypothetical protein
MCTTPLPCSCAKRPTDHHLHQPRALPATRRPHTVLPQVVRPSQGPPPSPPPPPHGTPEPPPSISSQTPPEPRFFFFPSAIRCIHAPAPSKASPAGSRRVPPPCSPHGERPLRAPLSSDRDSLTVPLPPCSYRAPSGPPPSTSATSSIGRHRAELPSPSQCHATSMVGPRCRLLTWRLDSAPLVLTVPTEPPLDQRRTAGELATMRAAAVVTTPLCMCRHAHESACRSLAFGPPSQSGHLKRLLATGAVGCRPKAGPTVRFFFSNIFQIIQLIEMDPNFEIK